MDLFFIYLVLVYSCLGTDLEEDATYVKVTLPVISEVSSILFLCDLAGGN